MNRKGLNDDKDITDSKPNTKSNLEYCKNPPLTADKRSKGCATSRGNKKGNFKKTI